MTKSRYHYMKHRHPGYYGCANKSNWKERGYGGHYRNSYSFPKVNIFEEDDHYLLEFNVPGYLKSNFKVSVHQNILKVEAKVDKDDEVQNVRRKEFAIKNFKREFELTEKADIESIAAEYSGGILAIKIGKKEEFHTKSREVKID